MINLSDVTKIYTISKEHQVTALLSINLEINKGEFLIITGRSGSGKTTLLNLVAGLSRPTTGKIIFDGTDLWELSDKQQSLFRGRNIGFIFQFPSLLPSLTSLENVLLPVIFSSDQNRQDAQGRAENLLESVGLSDKLNSLPRQLSAGQQQRVVIARALMNEPEVLLADEPTSDLDEQTENEIMVLFQKIHSQTGVTIAMVTHTSQLISFGTRSISMASGQIVEPEHT